MKIIYKGISMELVGYDARGDNIAFIFRNNGVKFALFKWDGRNVWYFGLNGRVPDDQKETNELYLFGKQIQNKFQEGAELYDYLFKKSPLRMKLLMDLGPNAYEMYK